MRIDKLRGYGPWFAFAVPFLFPFTMGSWVLLTDQAARAAVHQLIAVALPQGQPIPSLGVAVELWFVLWALIVLAGLVVAIDLARIERPVANTRMTYVALGGMVVATLASTGLLVGGFTNFLGAGGYYVVALPLGSAGLGVYLVTINRADKRAGLLGRVLPWLGIVSGALFLVAALQIALGLPGGLGYSFVPGAALYAAWSLWLGFRLRGKAPEQAVSSSS
jgi:hypothetical protein